MPVRIYALAKDLSVDSKELVEICQKAGISGKGSALASLDDDEVAKVKEFLSAAKKPAASSSTPSTGRGQPAREQGAYTRDDYIAPAVSGKIPVLKVAKRPPAKPAEETAEKASPKPPVEPTPQAPAKPEEKPPEQKPPEPKPPEVQAPIRETPPLDAPIRTSPPIEPAKPAKPVKKSPPKKREPVINLAKIPEIKQPAKKAGASEPQAQKPEIRLPKDAIAGHKAGARPPLEHLTKAADKKKSKDDGKSPGSGDFVAPGDVPHGAKGPSKRRRGGAEEGAPERDLAGMASARADRQKGKKEKLRTRGRLGRTNLAHDDATPSGRTRRPRTLSRRRGVNTAAPRKERVVLELPCSVRSFSEAAGIPSAEVLRALLSMGTMANINAQLDQEVAEMLAVEMGVELEFKQQESLEQSLLEAVDHQVDPEESLKPRPPVVTFLGHVDHGKTSLLDYIIGTNVVSGEAGGITQHIRAYEIRKGNRKIAFVDTPGHEAFTEMRARGANVTDIAVLVVAADDGVMPQTEEAISHAKAAEVPIIVALNKIDLPGADPDKCLQQLAALELLPSEWGGDVEIVRTSALTGDGMDELLETILLTADIQEYKANPSRAAVGVCLEAEQEPGRGVIAKVIVKNGTMSAGDVVVCGNAYGKIKAMYDTLRPKQKVKTAGPSRPVNITGLNAAPDAGEKFYVLEDISQARQVAETRADRTRTKALAGGTTKVSFEEFQRRLEEGSLVDESDIVNLNLIIRADVRGSIEAIQKELTKLDHPEVQIKVMQASVGGVTAADVMLAHASQAVIIGFNVIPDEAARSLADEKQVEIRRYDIIYKVTDDIKALLEGKLRPEERNVELGQALVKEVFPISRVGTVAGCYVMRGSVKRNCRIRVNRDGRTIGDYPLDSLRREKEDVKEVPRGMECGMKLAGFNDIKQGDILEAYEVEEIARTL